MEYRERYLSLEYALRSHGDHHLPTIHLRTERAPSVMQRISKLLNARRMSIFLVCMSVFICATVWYADETLYNLNSVSPYHADLVMVSPRSNHLEPLESIGGWAVAAACHRGAETLFFVHTAADNRAHRAVYRDTLAHPAASEHWNWTAVYFVGKTRDEVVAAWNHLEATAMGDTVILPFMDTYRNLSYKFVLGMHWVLHHCPNVKYIVKIDDDMFVHPTLLRAYMRTTVDPEERKFHCFVWNGMAVYRDPESRWFVPDYLFHDQMYYTYCSGRAIIMPGKIVRDLYEASKRIPPYTVDDAYVTGDLALATGVGHVDMSPRISFNEEEESDILRGRYIFAHLSFETFLVRRALWALVLQRAAQDSQAERKLIGKILRDMRLYDTGHSLFLAQEP
ncbi:beta-1,3-galactosyltransferase 5-like [Ornithodoros turicata]|uniref:beta-1,3-galactosyltransferase 5-like n=1 Tax=Ornithodoros turicata TaxID=34597 RepID=UPI003139C47D